MSFHVVPVVLLISHFDVIFLHNLIGFSHVHFSHVGHMQCLTQFNL